MIEPRWSAILCCLATLLVTAGCHRQSQSQQKEQEFGFSRLPADIDTSGRSWPIPLFTSENGAVGFLYTSMPEIKIVESR